MDMSKAIREGRDRLGMSQEALAERLGVSRQAVSKWEMGTSVPSPENRRALSEILGTDLQVERETAPPVPLRRWKRLTLAAGLLCLALLAALGTGALHSFDELAAVIRPGRVVQPDAKRHSQYEKIRHIYDSLYPATRGLMHEL